MKVLFVTDAFKVEPLGIAYLASAIKKAGHETILCKDTDAITEVWTYKPDIVGYSITTGKHKKFIDLNYELKKRFRFVSVFGGAHPTYFPEMANSIGVDTIIRGEGERSLVKLLDEIALHKKIKKVNDFETLEQNLDKILFPDREFLYRYEENRNNPIKNVMGSRGCKYACPYCFNYLYRSFYKGQNWVRRRSSENIIKECVELKKYPLGMIFFQDDEFISNSNLFELLDLYKKDVKVPYHCQIRIELLTEDIAKKLKDTGCVSVTFAIESGNDKIRKSLLCRNMTSGDIIRGAEILRRTGLRFRSQNMCGIPGESIKNMMETLDLNIKIKPTVAWCSIFQPYPKLKLGEKALELGCWNGNIDDIKETFFEDTILKTPLRKQIVNLQRLFGVVVQYPILRPLMRLLLMVKNNKWFDLIHKRWKLYRYDKVLYDYKSDAPKT